MIFLLCQDLLIEHKKAFKIKDLEGLTIIL